MYNILFVEGGRGAGGSSNYLWYFLKYLDREVFNPLVLFYRQYDGPDIEKIKSLGIEIFFIESNVDSHKESSTKVNQESLSDDVKKFVIKITKTIGIKSFLKFSYDLLFYYIPQSIKVKEFLKKQNIDCVFLNNDMHYHIPAIIGAKLTNIPCISRKAGIGGGRFIKRLLHPWVEYFIASSEGALKDYRIERLPVDKITLIYEGIDISRFNPVMHSVEIRQQLNIQSDMILVGSIARIAPGKGQFELIDAAPLILSKCPKVRFIIVGDDVEDNGRLLNELKLKAKHLGISEYCFFTGWRDDIPQILSSVDIFVHVPNGWLEALGIATLEAMAMAKPTVVTDNWGLAETTEDGVTVYVIPPGDRNALVNAITTFALEPEKIKIMGRKARERVEKLFDIRQNVKRTEKIILKVLNSHV